MFIVGQSRRIVVNMDNTMCIDVDGKRIVASTKVDDINLGVYKSDERASEVFEEMLKELFMPNLVVVKDADINHDILKEVESNSVLVVKEPAEVKMYECGAYYMPKE